MRYCLVCSEPKQHLTNLLEPFYFKSRIRKYLCATCFMQLIPINRTSCCRGCSKKGEDATICEECTIWENTQYCKLNHTGIFEYNTFAKDVMWKIKHNRDCELILLLIEIASAYVLKHKDVACTILVPFPTNLKSLEQRRFSVTHTVATALEDIMRQECLLLNFKREGNSQHNKKKKERMAYAHTLFTIDEELIKSIGGKELLLFDDVLTTGATMVAAYKSFEKIGITQVQSFSIFR